VLIDQGPRQHAAVALSEEKRSLITSRDELPNLVRTDDGQGEIYRTTVIAKLFMLATIKFATMDSFGMGIEMEAGKPGWYDALNGLPGLFGSSLAETFELQRLIQFLLLSLAEKEDATVNFPVEFSDLFLRVVDQIQTYNASTSVRRDYQYWNAISGIREEYRVSVRRGIDGCEETYSAGELAEALTLFLEKIRSGVARALELNKGFPPTYFKYEVQDFEIIHTPNGDPALEMYARNYIQTKDFKPVVLPLFLEGPVRMMKTLSHKNEAHELYERVKNSSLFDRTLKMYKVNASLEKQSHEIGRARAFTPGWLENESIWLHMEYKYLLEVLKAGLYEEFFDDFSTVLIPFQNPSSYRRSPLENSSFIVSSAHPDESLHGAGFVARLSGATAEFIHMWTLMMVGKQPFTLKDGELHLCLRPTLPGWLFDAQNQISFTFLGSIPVTYHNPQRVNTWNLLPNHIKLRLPDGQNLTFHTSDLSAPFAAMVRNREVESIDVFFS
jgi:hypothetical protein